MDPRFDPEDRGKSTNQGGVSVPVKGDSSNSNPPPDSDSPTVADFRKPSSDSAATFIDPDATIIEGALPPLPPLSTSGARPSRVQAAAPMLDPGDVLGGRYEILQLLGEGGMGAVYKAQDRELDRPVALKLIRPELASNPSILARFKQELLLSRQVTHKNVIRIFDLGDADGVKFITMEFVEGHDLRALIQEKKKFSPEEAVEIMQQVCQALEAAHGVGVIHRDLKPQNIMREANGRILVMDFGLARTMEGDGMTQVGALVGTMEYMSPEQALAKELDQRSDLFTAGLILYELLTGKMPFRAESALASLIKRTQERAVPVSDHDQTIPGALSGIVSKCLEREPNLRYQSATEMLRELDSWQGNRAAATLGFHPDVKPWGQTTPWPLLMGVVTVLILAIVGYVFRGPLFSPSARKAAAGPALSLAVMPFKNASGDDSWDWLGPSLADMLSTDVGQSSHLRTVSPDRVQQVFHDLRIAPNSIVDSSTLGRVAEFTNADTLVWGQYTRLGDQIRIDATLQDRKHNRTVQVKSEASSQKDLSAAVDRLAEMIRQNLALSPDLVKELQAQSFKPTSTSVEALRDYNEGLQFLRQGNNLEAQKRLQTATTEDPQFAVAYSRLGEAYSALGYDTEAEQASRRAVELSQTLPLAQRYFVEASLARVTKDNQKAIAAYENLEKSFPDNLDVLFALGSLNEDAGNLDKARSLYSKVLQADGKNLDALLAMGRVEIKSGNPQQGLDPLDRARHIAIDLDNAEQQALILQATGIAYKLLNKPTEALRNYEDSMAINQKLGQKRGVAASLVEIAQVQLLLGKPDAALAAYNDALKIRREIGAKKETGDTLIDLGDFYIERGQPDQAMQAFKESLQIQRDAGDETYQGVCLNNIAAAYSQKGENQDALTYLLQALQIREKINVPSDIAATLHNLGEAYAALGQYDEAMTSLMRGLDLYRKSGDNQGAARMSYGMGLVFGYQGRLGPAIGALQDAVKAFRDLGERSSTSAESLSSLAGALAMAGRGTESAKLLDEAQGQARALKNDALLASVLNSQGDTYFYQGDLKSAKGSYEQALRLATHSNDKNILLTSKLNVTRVAVADGRSRAEVNDLRNLAQQADSQGRKYISVSSSVLLADALIKNKDYSAARQELQRTMGKSEKLGLRLENAKIHYLLGTALRLSGSGSEATAQYRDALRLLDEIRKEQGAEHVTERYDLKTIYSESTQFSQ
ncbi:MAG TPA: tetratricopeptide repeat protein [Candidatus Sulfotelmatobacter sp.]|nr:tetratricopeptide repeat protein [Candidatus Sulfotelmatobacter sp.]